MNRKTWRIPLLVLRYGLCAVAIAYLATHVSWFDYVTLTDGGHARVRLLSERDGVAQVRFDNGVEAQVDDQHVAGREYGIAGILTRLKLGLALLSLLFFAPVPLLQSQRLVWMMAVQDVKLTFWQAVKLSFAGNFFNFALPGTTGGDVIKAYYVTQYTHHKTEAVTGVFLDRVIGMLGLVTLATIMFAVSIGRVSWNPQLFHSIVTGLVFLWAGLLVGCVMVFSQRMRGWLRLPSLAQKLPAGQHLLRVGRATVAMRRHKTITALCLVNTVLLQLAFVLSAYTMALALGMRGPATLYFMCVPLGYLIAAVPISPPQAFGVMEWAFIQFFTPGGLNTAPQAVTFALATRVIQLVWALPGVLVPLLGAHMPTQAEIEDLEQPESPESQPAINFSLPPGATTALP